ncbi:MAG: class I SAM-dependent methyltransferase [Desulfomonile sp.]|nr:class I SAM-dependent methyltransferase [Desulfomonile sp.]
MTEPQQSWSLGGGPGTLVYGVYDRLRHGVSRNLVNYFLKSGISMRRVLEAGSGPGFTTSLLASTPGVKCAVAVDFDEESLREGRRRDSSLKAAAGNVYTLPFADGSFDLVWNSSTLEHLSNMDTGLLEMVRVCAPGGHVFVGVPYRWGPLFFQPFLKGTRAGEWLGPVFTTHWLVSWFFAAGLKPKSTHFYFWGFFVGVLGKKLEKAGRGTVSKRGARHGLNRKK